MLALAKNIFICMVFFLIFALFLMRSASRGASPSRHHVPHFRPSLLYFYITLFHNLPDCQGAAVASPLPPPPFISSSAFTSLTPSPRPSLPLPLLQSGSAAARSLDAFTKKKKKKKSSRQLSSLSPVPGGDFCLKLV